MCDVSTCGVDDAVCVCDVSTCGGDDVVCVTYLRAVVMTRCL